MKPAASPPPALEALRASLPGFQPWRETWGSWASSGPRGLYLVVEELPDGRVGAWLGLGSSRTAFWSTGNAGIPVADLPGAIRTALRTKAEGLRAEAETLKTTAAALAALSMER